MLHEMFARVRSEPATVTLFRGWTRLTTDDQGDMRGTALHGFFVADTQLLSHYELRLDDQPISHRVGVQVAENAWSSVGTLLHSADTGDLPEGTLPNGSIELRVLRVIDGGWSELVIVRNNGVPPREVELALRLGCPLGAPELAGSHDRAELRFAKRFGARDHAPTRELARVYGAHAPRDGEPVTRELAIVARVLDGAPVTLRATADATVTAHLRLPSRGEVRLGITYEPSIDGARIAAPELAQITARRPAPRRGIRVTSHDPSLALAVGQAIVDLDALALPVFGPSRVGADEAVALSGGIPRYIGLFGRDNLIAARQSLVLGTHRAEGVLQRLALLQGVRRDDWRDEEPDRLPHEHRLDARSELGTRNRELYYGDVTGTLLWPIALAELYRWTGDRALLDRHGRTLARCCDWIARRLDAGGGFIYYQPSAASNENRNQAWKDSGDGVVDGRGRVRVPPLALCEVQGYAYQALRETAHLLDVLGDGRGDRLRELAGDLKRRFDDRFWMPDARFYAMALAGDGEQVDCRASNIGHCLGTAIIRDDRREHVVRALLADDLFSGWGIRTLSTDNPAYDPFSYHRGSVWPVENALIAAGLRACGCHGEAERVTTAQLALAGLFPQWRLPEVVSGHARTDSDPTPGLYPFANLLQAWSVSAIAQHLQALLGLWPRADVGALYVDPHLPPWLDWVEVHDLAVGGEALSLRFWRDAAGATAWTALAPPRALELRGGPPPSRP